MGESGRTPGGGRLGRRLGGGALLALLALPAGAGETRYISDQLEVTLRTGKSLRHQIIKLLPSGTPVELLEVDPASGYSRVRTRDGKEGWVITRYLMDTPSARDRLAEAQRRLASLQIEHQRLQQRLAQAEQARQALEAAKAKLGEENRKLRQELAYVRRTAANALAIDGENKHLKEQLVSLQTEVQALQQENASLRDRSDQQWFLRGAGVVIAGILLGLLLPRLRVQRRSRWDRL